MAAAGEMVSTRILPLPDETPTGICPADSYEKSTMTGWPLRSGLELGALPSAVPCARLHTKQMLWEWALENVSDSVEVIVSELMTNAVAASARLTGSRYRGQWRPGVPPVRLDLCSDKERVLIEVWDGDDRLPEPQRDEVLAESGRGLLLVATLSTERGTYKPQGASGKTVWAYVTRANGGDGV